MPEIHTGGCRCRKVLYSLQGVPLKVGICHCTTCRKETGSAFLFYADWYRRDFKVTGEFATYDGRSFCPECGSSLFHLDPEYVEVCVGSLDEAPTEFTPSSEGWIIRREHWLPATEGAIQADRDP